VDLSNAALDAIVIVGPARRARVAPQQAGPLARAKGGEIRPFGPLQIFAYPAIGVYAGLVVLGSGFFMLAALVLLTGYDLNAETP
jgi:uncharacterized membrane protein YfcA